MTDTKQPTNSVVIERSLAAPIDLVWKMWTDPEHFKAWYGPQGATIPVAEFDLRVGGRRFVGMEANTPNGAMQMWFTGEHLTVAEPDRLAYTESMADENGNVKSPASLGMPEGHPTTTEVHVELVADGNTTKMVLTHVGIPAGSPGEMGWNMAFEKLSAYVAAASQRMTKTKDGNMPEADQTLFWDLIDELRTKDRRVEEGTIMGGRCARVAGEFLALVDFKNSGLVVKLPRARVDALVAEGVGQPFAPAGKVFREWVAIPERDRRRWRKLLNEAVEFVAPKPGHV